MKPKHQRSLFIIVSLFIMAIAATVILKVFSDNLMYFYTPTMLDAKRLEADYDSRRSFRLGGLVKDGSIKHLPEGNIRFVVTDGAAEYPVSYSGMLPTLFREGQGVVLVGTLTDDNSVKAETILAKHDENYMPPEVARALKESGHWGGKGSSYTPDKASP